MMVLNQTETDFFFLDATQTGFSIPVKAALQMEVIIEVDDLLEFDDDQCKTVVRKLQQVIHFNNTFQMKSGLNWNW